ncbi:3-carboxyethylcatechol 2,3-dioxygenase [Streptomyces sp. NPDC005134]|uniref:3-carboxyethylcatechol 2,3-dioxygenase n=1 Tax=Streptomyces sp. NPDC005098 TaxID=3154560 RepID=UPI0033A3F678
MPLALCCLSHSPLLDLSEHPAELTADVEKALARARSFVQEFEPDLVVLFTPDHYNGFFYRLMPPFCIGLQASGVGDYGTAAGPLDVPRNIAEGLAEAVLDAGLDLSVSVQMEVDHGAAQPLEKLFGGINAVPVVPVFINSVAAPLGPMRRIRLLGEAIGRHLAGRSDRVLLLGSGGLSHDPPVPTLAAATGPVAERIVTGRPATADERAARQKAVIEAGAGFAEGTVPLRPLNPTWDQAFLDLLETGELAPLDDWSNAWVEQQGGGSAHEVRTWVAAHAAMAASGGYETTWRYYRPIPEYIAGFALTTAVARTVAGAQ